MDVRKEERLSVELHAMRNTDVRYKSAWACGLDRLFHRLLRTYTLQYGIRTDALSQFFDPRYTFATTLSHMSVAPNSRLLSVWPYGDSSQ